MKNYEKTIFKLLVGVVMLCGAMAVFAQQLPEIIWNKVAHNPPNPEFARTDSIKFSPDGELLYAGGGVQFSSQDVGSITTFAAADGMQLDATSLFFQIAAINELTLFANGQRLATAHNDVACNPYLTDCKYGYILYDPQTLIRLSVPVTDRIGVKTIDYSSADQLLAVGNFLYSNNILILDSNALSVIRTLPGHGGGTFSVRFSPDGQFLASGGGDGTVKIWRVSDSSLVRTFNFDPSNDVYSVAFSPDGQYIAAADTDNGSSSIATVRVWRVSDGALIRNFDNSYPNHIIASRLAWTPNGRYIVDAAVSGFIPSRIRFWNLDSGQLTNEYFGDSVQHAISAIEFAPDGGTFAFSLGSRVLLARNPVAPVAATVPISGTVTYGNAVSPPKFISDATVTGAGSPNVSAFTLGPGRNAGQYMLSGFGAGSYTVSLSKTTEQNGITSNDAARIAQHVAGTLLLTNNNQKVTADVTGNGAISSQDAAKVAQFVSGLPYSTQNLTGTWHFFVPPGPTFPIAGSPTSRTYSSVTSNLTGEDYIGLLMGEVTGNWTPSAERSVSKPQDPNSKLPEMQSFSANRTVETSGSAMPAGRWQSEVDRGPERGVSVKLSDALRTERKEIVVPVNVDSVADKGVISYEFDLRYDPSVIQPQANPVDLAGSVSRGLTAVANATVPGVLRVVVYGPMPINNDGVLLNLRFTAVGKTGTVSPLIWERMMFNEGEPRVIVYNGRIELF